MLFETFVRASRFFFVGDGDEKEVSFVMLQAFGIVMASDLGEGCFGGFVIF